MVNGRTHPMSARSAAVKSGAASVRRGNAISSAERGARRNSASSEDNIGSESHGSGGLALMSWLRDIVAVSVQRVPDRRRHVLTRDSKDISSSTVPTAVKVAAHIICQSVASQTYRGHILSAWGLRLCRC